MLTQHSKTILSGRYTQGAETPEDVFKRVARVYGSNPAHSERLYSYMERMWFMPATPILANGGTGRGLPISCFLQSVGDSREAISGHFDESLWMSTSGGGLGASWSDIRSAGIKTSRGIASTGAIQYLHIFDALSLAGNQGNIRQGSYAAYLDMSHPEILEFIRMRTPSGGDIHRKNLNLHHGVNVSDAFMEAFYYDKPWDLIDPHTKQVVRTVQATDLWNLLMETRSRMSEPYVHFIDRSNQFLHPDLKALGRRVNGSNLCSEIVLPTAEDYSAVCCLSSVNINRYLEWQGNYQFIRDVAEFLDNVLQDFINTAPSYLRRAVRSAMAERSIGIGGLGWHSFLQSQNIPFESLQAYSYNNAIWSEIKEHCIIADQALCAERGSAGDLKSNRFAHMLAVAPNATTSLIAGESPSIEPWEMNLFMQKTVSGALTMKNQNLDEVLRKEYSSDRVDAIWKQVGTELGSVQGIEGLSQEIKDVYKTASELDQRVIVSQAAARQKYICQSQSVNLFFKAGVDMKYFGKVHFEAWEKGLKTLYYVRGEDATATSKTHDGYKTVDLDAECTWCQG